ncbi:MAG: hypothetical protein AAF902_09900 [Chloroflexota bacterium]
MNLAQIFRIFRRRWLFMVIPAALVLAITILTAEEAVIPPPSYNVGVRFLISPPLPADNATAEEEARYYQWLTSEYLTNGLADWVNGIGFAEKVAAKTAEKGYEVDPLVLFNGTSADAIRSRLTIIMNYSDRDALQALMESAIEVIAEENASGIPHLGLESPAEIVLLDRPVVNEVPASIGNQLDLPIRIVLAIITGLLIGFVVEYFDPYIRDKQDVAETGLPILAHGKPDTVGRKLRDALLLQETVPNSIVIAGTVGKVIDEMSLEVAYSLAQAMALSGRKTVLVDGILERPLLHTMGSVDNKSGFAESLANNDPIRLQRTKIENLSMLSGGNAGDRAPDLMSSPHLPGIVAGLKKASDILIFVAPPPMSGMASAVLAHHVDGVVLHIEQGLTWHSGLEMARDTIGQTRSTIMGCVVV